MEFQLERERRRSARYPTACTVSAQEVSSAGTPREGALLIEGEICNLSEGGCCILSDQACAESALLKCRISPPNLAAGIPTLMQVRWTRRDPARGFALGVNFLLE